MPIIGTHAEPKATKCILGNFLYVILFALLKLRVSEDTHKQQKNFESMQAPSAS